MLIFSTRLSVNDKLTKDEFVKLVIEWNNTSKYEDNIIPGIIWDGKYTVSYAYQNLSLDFVEYTDRAVIAARYVKKTDDGITWNSDYILNLKEKKICIQLDRSYSEDSIFSDQSFSTPHFISMLIERGYLDTDNGMSVMRKPVSVDMDSIQLFIDILFGGRPYRLPIVYVSRSMHNKFAVNVTELAYRLKGVAHVVVAKNRMVCDELRKRNKRIETDGDIGIYFLSDARRHKSYKYTDFMGSESNMLNHIVSCVINYSNIMEIDSLYTWNGLNREILRERIENLRKQSEEAQAARKKDKIDNDELMEEYEVEIKTMQQQVNEYSNLVASLELENHGLRQKISGKDALPVLYFGKEADLYPGEIKDLLLRILSEQRKGTKDGTRRAHILDDIIDSNEYIAESERLEKKAKDLMVGYKTMSGTTRQGLKEIGFEISEDGAHYKITYHGDGRYMTTLAKTGSDYREGRNIAQTIIKMVF
ncbi:MAG: hypothetical protein K6G43_00300 [Lachnospiraceae bacterium]|nr:hypothetical protein [Lachnospiraceae bacterium]